MADASGFEHFPLFGLSQGGAIAIAYAARHPDRVERLILCGAYAQGRYKRDPTPQNIEAAHTVLKLIDLGWGKGAPAFRQVFTAMIVPDATAEQQRAFDDLQWHSTSAANAVRILSAFNSIDVVASALAVTCPTLVAHSNKDECAPFEAGRRVAALIPHARFMPLETRNHVLLATEPAWRVFMDEVLAFVPAAPPEAQAASRNSRRASAICWS